MAWLGRGDGKGPARYDATRLEGVDAVVSCVTRSPIEGPSTSSVAEPVRALGAGCDGDAVSCRVAVPHRTMPWSHGPRDAPGGNPRVACSVTFTRGVHAARWAKDLFVDLFVEAPRGQRVPWRSRYAQENLT